VLIREKRKRQENLNKFLSFIRKGEGKEEFVPRKVGKRKKKNGGKR